MTPATWRHLIATPQPAWPRRLALGGLCALLLMPLLVVNVPPLLDYPNHLARAWVLSRLDHDPLIASMYEAHWALIPNLATDLILLPLLHLLPVYTAGRLLLAGALLLPVWAALRYSRVTFRRRGSWPALSCLVACNGLFLLGFINFQIGTAVALAAAAEWARHRGKRPRVAVAVGTVASVALFFLHLMGVFFFLLLVAGHEAERLIVHRRDPGSWRRRAVRRVLPLGPLVLGPALLLLFSPFSSQSGDIEWGDFTDKPMRAATAVLNYDLPLDLGTAALVVLFVALCADRRWLAAPPRTVLPLGALALLFLVAPFGFNGTGYIASRLAVMAGLLLFAGILPARIPRRVEIAACAGFGLLFGIRSVEVADVWAAHADDLADFRQVARAIPPGARVLTALVDDDEVLPGHEHLLAQYRLSDGTRLDGHLGALLVMERRAFWPALFANPGQQPLALREPYRGIAARTVGLPNLARLSALAPDGAPDPNFPIEGRWSCCYDYVLMTPRRARPGFGLANLEVVRDNDFATLFRPRDTRVGSSDPMARLLE